MRPAEKTHRGRRRKAAEALRPLLVRMGRLLRAARLRAGLRLVDVGTRLSWREGRTYTRFSAAKTLSKIERGLAPIPSWRVLTELLNVYGDDVERTEIAFLWLEHLYELPPTDAIAGGLVFASVLEAMDESTRQDVIDEALRLARKALVQARRGRIGG